MHYILMGLPGAGKGTQATSIVEKYHMPHISTGQMFRTMIKAETDDGLVARKYIDKGQLVADDITVQMVRERLQEDDCRKGFLLDGFPRTISQANALDEILKSLNISLDAVISIEVPEEELLKRLSGRRVCTQCGANYHMMFNSPQKEGVCDLCGGQLVQREDDKEETIKTRLEINREQTRVLKDYYTQAGLLREINGTGDVQEVFERICHVIEGK